MAQPSSQAESAPTVNENAPRTRYGRVSKPPVRYEPIEQVEDDYADDDYDTVESDIDSNEPSDDDDEETDESDADDDGNLDGFVVPDKSESDDDSTDGEPAVPVKGRGAPVKKRPTPVRK
jgi:hypothetical protein